MILKSIRWRLQIWYGVVFVAVLAGFGVTAYQLERNRELRDLDEQFQTRLRALSRPPQRQGGRPGGPPPRGGRGGRGGGGPDFGGEGPPDGSFGGQPGGPPDRRPFPGPGGGGGGGGGGEFQLPPIPAGLFGVETNSFYYVIWSPDGNVLAKSDAAPQDIPEPSQPNGPDREPPPPRMRGVFRELYHGGPSGEIFLVGRSIANELAGLQLVKWSLAGAGAVVLLLGLAGGWWIATLAIRPIEDISATAVKISAGDLSQRISAADTDSELGRLAAVLNSTFSRLDAAFAQQRQFTSDAAHELRTPLSVILTQTQTVLARERGAEEYRAAVEACQRAAQRMRKLTESLLQLARLDAGQENMRQTNFDLSKLVRDCAELVAPLGTERGIKIQCDLPELPCLGDPERLGQVVTNLLANAIEYNKEGGEVRVSGGNQSGTVMLTVADTGQGIAAEDLPRVFDRFYRADKSRSTGHSGLGLAISKAIVEAHGGAIEVSSQEGAGAAFTLRLPAATQKQ